MTETEFWQAIYVAAIRSGYQYPNDAINAASRGVRELRELIGKPLSPNDLSDRLRNLD